MSYLASPFWLFQLIVGIALVLQTTYIRPEYFSQDFRLFPVWPRFDPERALALFALTIGDPARAEAVRPAPDAARPGRAAGLRRGDPAHGLGR